MNDYEATVIAVNAIKLISQIDSITIDQLVDGKFSVQVLHESMPGDDVIADTVEEAIVIACEIALEESEQDHPHVQGRHT